MSATRRERKSPEEAQRDVIASVAVKVTAGFVVERGSGFGLVVTEGLGIEAKRRMLSSGKRVAERGRKVSA